MPQADPSKYKLSLWKKSLLTILGIAFSIMLLEIGLRLGGFIFATLQEYRNREAVFKKGAYRIMCLGESTTAGSSGSYPSQLEEILNQRNIGISFSVINKGVPAVNTSYILDHLEENLNQCQPDMVTAMIGSNDSYIKYYEHVADRDTMLFNNFRAYRLFRILCAQSGNTGHKNTDIDLLGDDAYTKWVHRGGADKVWLYFEMGLSYRWQGRYAQAEEVFKKSIALNPKEYIVYVELGSCYREQAKYSLAVEMFQKATQLNPANDRAYFELGLCYMLQNRYSEAQKIFSRVTALNPENDRAYGGLGSLYEHTGDYASARESYTRANALRSSTTMTRINYLKLKTILDERGIKLVCIQYPVRSIEPLRRIFQGQSGVIFVDNERIFKDALKKAPYQDYFTDMFGGDFGHCTRRGNRLLAENIANVILGEYFKK